MHRLLPTTCLLPVARLFRRAFALLITLAAALPAAAQARPLDTARSSLTIYVGRSGIFSFAGDNHQVRAPLASGSVEEAAKRVEFQVQSKSLRVEDPGVAPEKRAQIQQRMLSSDVLDSEHFPLIQFRSSAVSGAGRELRVIG